MSGAHPNITLLTYSEVEQVDGYVGNFTVRVRKKARKVDEEPVHRLRCVLGKMPDQGRSIRCLRPGWAIARRFTAPSRRPCPKYPVIDIGELHLLQDRQMPHVREGVPDRSDPI